MTRKAMLTYGFLAIGLGLSAYLLWNIFAQYSWSDIVGSVAEIPARNLVLALIFSGLSYLCLTGFDWIGIRHVRSDLAYPKIALASFVSLSIGQSIGLSGLSSGGLRYRYYAHWGLSVEDVAKVILISGVTVGLGLVVLAGIVMIINPADVSGVLKIEVPVVIAIGGTCLALAIGYLALAAFARAPVHVHKWTFQMPTLQLAAIQIVIGTVNFALVSAALWEVMGAAADISYLKAATAYVLANVAIIITHAPGGLGVLEATVRHIMGDQASIGSLVAFRVIYFFIPMGIGIPLALVAEAIFRSRKSRSAVSETGGAG